jgi:hypothetical protein
MHTSNRRVILFFSLLLLVGCGSSSAGDPVDVQSDGAQETLDAVQAPDTLEDAVADLTADTELAPDADDDVTIPPFQDPGVRLREAGWLRGDLHLHTTVQGGDDSVATVLAIAEYLEDPVFLAAHPEYEGNGVDFLAITDHRVASVANDPAFVSDRLVLLSGEEFGGPGHAGLWGITQTVQHDPDGDGATLEDYLAGVESAHSQGGLFGVNHPFLGSIPFPWDVRTHDAVELVNTGWALGSADYTPEELAVWEANNGPASPFFRKGVQHQGGGGSMQALVYYEALLARGVHIAVVGGSDRHVLFPVAFPTTWVLADAADPEGVLDGIRERRTFVSRTPASATVELSVTTADGAFGIGAEATGTGTVSISARAGRAAGGQLRIVSGHAVGTDDGLDAAILESNVTEVEIVGDDFAYQGTLDVLPGDWVYAMVLEPLVAEGLPSDLAQRVPELAQLAASAGVEDYDGLVNIFWDFIDPLTLLSPQDCDPANWDPWMLQCLVADSEGIGGYYVPDWLSRALNAWTLDGLATEWSVGAVSSAIVFK